MAAGDQIARVGETITETFFLTDSTGAALTGAAASVITVDFARNPSDVSFASSVTLGSKGNGEDTLAYSPTAVGTWRIAAHTAYEDIYSLVVVAPATAKPDEPFVWRVGDRVTVYDYEPAAAVAVGSWSLQYARDPNDAAFSPTLVHVGGGEFRITFTSTLSGRYRAEWVYLGYVLTFELQVVSASATTASGLTRANLRREIADRLGYLVTGTLTSVTNATTVLDTSRFEPQNHFNGGYLYLTTGGALSQSRRITNWNSSTKTFTVAPGFSVTPALGDTYEAYLGHPLDRYNRAIDAGIRAYAHLWGTDVVDSSTLVTSTVDTYSVPAGIDVLYSVELQTDQTYNLYQPIPAGRWGWEALLEGSNPKVRFHKDVLRRYSTVDFAIRFRGQQDAQTLTTDSDQTMIPSTVIVPWACAYLLRTQNQGIASGESARSVPDFLNEVQGALLLEPPGRTFQSDSVRVRQ